MNNVKALAVLIREQRQTLLTTWRQQVRQLPSARNLDTPTLNDHIPALLDELADALQARSDQTIAEALVEGSPPAHGVQRLRKGYDIEEVVAEYNVLRGCIHDLAQSHGLSLEGESFHIVNRVLDRAIGLAVQSFADEQAREVQKRRDEYLAFVAHDLRTPLNAIAVATSILEIAFEDREAAEETAATLKTLRRNVQQLQALVEKIIEENANVGPDAGLKLERRQFDLWPLVEGLVFDLRPLAQANNTRLINQVPRDLIISADASLVRRVFQNLISNAIKHTHNGEVWIGARQSAAQSAVECWVRDSGVGIPKDQLARVFDEAEHGAPGESGASLGLGLAIVKTFVEAHGGQVTAESEQGRGSTFRFTLPSKT